MPTQALIRSLECPACHCGRGKPCRTWTPDAPSGRKYRERAKHHIQRIRAAQAIQRSRKATTKPRRGGMDELLGLRTAAKEIIDGIDVTLNGLSGVAPGETELQFRGDMAYAGFDDVLVEWRESLYNALEGKG